MDLDPNPDNCEIYFARLDSQGQPIGDHLRITQDFYNSRNPQPSPVRLQYGMVWWDKRTGNDDLFFTRLSPAGARIGTDTRVSYTPWGSYNYSKTLVWTGSEYATVWLDYGAPPYNYVNNAYLTLITADAHLKEEVFLGDHFSGNDSAALRRVWPPVRPQRGSDGRRPRYSVSRGRRHLGSLVWSLRCQHRLDRFAVCLHPQWRRYDVLLFRNKFSNCYYGCGEWSIIVLAASNWGELE